MFPPQRCRPRPPAPPLHERDGGDRGGGVGALGQQRRCAHPQLHHRDPRVKVNKLYQVS